MSILDQILESTRARVAKSIDRLAASDLVDLPFFQKETTSLEAALTRDPVNIIAEIKRASPSAGVLEQDSTVVAIAEAYASAGAAAISVLTEPEYFNGSLEDLNAIATAVSIPVLRKEFIVTEYQVTEARAYGADAILLIARILDASQLADLHEYATSLDLDVLVELYDEKGIDKLNLDVMKVVGANNRDLATMQVDINRSINILANIPDSSVRVSESGISQPEQLQTLVDNGIKAALIGESLMRDSRPGEALAALLQPFQKTT